MSGKRRILSVFLVLILIIGIGNISFAQLSDIESHWAKDEILKLIEEKIILGYPDGTYKPDKTISRGELYIIVNRILNLNAENVQNPDEPINRGEAVKVLGQAFRIKNDDSNIKLGFSDEDRISEDLADYLKGMKEGKYISGYTDGSFKPENIITRAEIAKVINNMCEKIYGSAQVYTGTVNGNMIVNGSEINLKDAVVKGDLYIAGVNSFKGENIKVEGRVIILGGTKGTVVFTNSAISKIIVDREGVNLELKGTNIKELEVLSKNVAVKSDSKIENLIAGEDVTVNGSVIKKGQTLPKAAPAPVNQGGGNSGGGNSGGGNNSGGEDEPSKPEEKKIEAEFYESRVRHIGKVSVSVKGIKKAEQFSVKFRYFDGSEETVGPVNIGNTTEDIYYNKDSKYKTVDIEIYGKNGELLDKSSRELNVHEFGGW
jgi:RNase P/RNase MRP subunit p29